MAMQHPEPPESRGLAAGRNTRRWRGAVSLLLMAPVSLRKGHPSSPKSSIPSELQGCRSLSVWFRTDGEGQELP